MTTAPNTFDRNRPTAQRMWPAESRIPLDFTRNGDFVPCLFVLRRDDIVPAKDSVVSAFDAFDRTSSSRCIAIEALWQLAVASAISLVSTGAEIYLEVVYESSSSSSASLASTANPSRLTKRQFMQMGINVNTQQPQQQQQQHYEKVVEYRFWFYVRTILLYDAEVKRATNYASQIYLARARSNFLELHIENEDRRRHQAIAGRALQHDALFMSDVAGDDECWSLLCTADRFAAAYAAYVGNYDPFADEKARHAFQTLTSGPFRLFDARSQLAARGELDRYFDDVTKTWRFPQPQHVWRVPAHMLQSMATLRIAYAPDYQQRVVEPLLAANFFDNGEARLAAHDFLTTPKGSSTGGDATLLDSLSAHFATKLQECAALPTPEARAQRRLLIQDAAFAIYEARLSLPDVACHSQTSQTILRYWNSEHRASTTIDYSRGVPNDRALTEFGCMLSTLLLEYERLHFVHSAHLDLLLLELALCNSYWHKRALHVNVLLLNDPDYGKSFALELVAQRAIPGSVLPVSRATAAAHSVDGDHNDRVLSFDEYPQELLVAPRGAASSRAIDDEKQRLTKCSVTTLAFQAGKKRKRQQSVCVSEQIGVTLGASNERRTRINAAIESRFALRVSEQPHRVDGATVEQRDAARVADESTQRLASERAVATDRQRWLQFLHREVEKLIKIRALHDVTMAVFDVCSAVVTQFARNRLGLRIRTRSINRVRLIARTLVVRQALWHLKLQPTTFRVSQLADADLHLHDNEELVYFTLEMMLSELVDTRECRILGGMRRLARSSVAVTYKVDDVEYVHIVKHNILKNLAETWRVSAEELQSSISALFQRKIPSKHYQLVDGKPVIVDGSVQRLTPLLIKDAANNIYMHCSVVDLSDGAFGNPVHYAIEHGCLNVGTPLGVKWLRGLTHQTGTPHLLAVRRLVTHSNEQTRRALHRNEDDSVYIGRRRLATDDGQAPVCSLDEFSVRERLQALDLPLVNDAQLEALLNQSPSFDESLPAANYPREFVATFIQRRSGVVMLSLKRPREENVIPNDNVNQ